MLCPRVVFDEVNSKVCASGTTACGKPWQHGLYSIANATLVITNSSAGRCTCSVCSTHWQVETKSQSSSTPRLTRKHCWINNEKCWRVLVLKNTSCLESCSMCAYNAKTIPDNSRLTVIICRERNVKLLGWRRTVGQLNRCPELTWKRKALTSRDSSFCKHLLMLHSKLLVEGAYECLNSFYCYYWNIVLKVAS